MLDFLRRFRTWIAVALAGTAATGAGVMALTSTSTDYRVYVGSTPTPPPGQTATPTPTPTPTPGSCDANASNLTELNSAVSSASGGDTVCLTSSSNYGNYQGHNKSSPGVTITAADGASPSMRFDLTSGDNWITIDGVEIGGGHSFICSAGNITVRNAEVANYMQTCGGTSITLGPGLVFTYAEDEDGSGLAFEGRLSIINTADSSFGASGLLVTGNTFGDTSDDHSNCADGIFSNSGGWTLEHSTFANLTQGPASDAGLCGPHVDAIQWYAGSNGTYENVIIRDSYFYDSQSGIVDYNSHGVNIQITNSVFENIPPYGINPCAAICVKGTDDELVDHVTVWDAAVQIGSNNNGGNSEDAIVRNSILQSPVVTTDFCNCGGGPPVNFAQDYNYCISGTCSGSNSLNGDPDPSWVGPLTSLAGWVLSDGTRGTAAASDGLDIGYDPDFEG